MSEPPPPRPDVPGDEGSGATPFATWRHLHPAAIAVWIAGIVGGFAIPLVVLVLLGGERGPLFFSTVFGSIAVIGSVIRWTRFLYRLDGQTLVVRGGLLQRWERTLQPTRIQSVDVVQKLTHRLFGVVELRIEVVGGTGTEAALVALTPEEATQLRALLMADHDTEVDRTEPALVRMRPADLLLAGATGGRVAVVAAMAGWVVQFLPDGTFVETMDRLAGADRSDLETFVVIAAALLLASVLISLVSTILVYWDFTALRQGDRLVITRGLLQTRRSVVPVARIQAIRIEENPIRRVFGLASLRVLTAGYGRGSGDEQQSSMLIPVADRQRCLAIAEGVLGSVGLRDVEIHRAPPRAFVRRLCLAAIVGLAALTLGLVFRGGALAAALLILPLAIGYALMSWRALGHAVIGQHVLARSGGLVRRTTVANHANIQHLILRRSPTQRPFGIASVTLAIPKAATSVIDVEDEVAEQRFDDLAARLVG
ncbi:MAG: PH domain-containing protein [Actinomycetota bacterium]|nr:PH domain-containing protein [Actinomycetota bacterium]